MQAGLQSLISDSCPCLQNALDKKKKKKAAVLCVVVSFCSQFSVRPAVLLYPLVIPCV